LKVCEAKHVLIAGSDFNAFWFTSMLFVGVLVARYDNANYELTVLLLIAASASTIMSRLDALRAAIDGSTSEVKSRGTRDRL
jgi:hypothetical protein